MVNFVAPTAHDKTMIEQNLEVACKNAFNTMFLAKFGAHSKNIWCPSAVQMMIQVMKKSLSGGDKLTSSQLDQG